MASTRLQVFTDANFDAEVIASSLPVLVDFWAPWCMPCRMLNPTVEGVADDLEGRVRVGTLDTDAERGIADRYRISAIPTLILFMGGEAQKKFVGLTSQEDIVEAIESIVGARSG